MTVSDVIVANGGTDAWKQAFVTTSEQAHLSPLSTWVSFLSESAITMDETDYLGYYVIEPETRTLKGITPLSWLEISIALVYAFALLVGGDSSVETLVAWVKQVVDFYAMPEFVVQNVLDWTVLS